MSLLSHSVFGFDLDPMAFINPFTTVSEIMRISKEEEEKPKIAAALEASTTADQKAIAAIAQAMSTPESLANAQAAQSAIDAANAAGKNVAVDKRLIPIKETLARAEANQKATTNPHIAQMRGNLVEAAQVVAVAVGSKQPIPQLVLPPVQEAAPAAPVPVLDRVTLLRQRAAAATAEYEKLKAHQNKNKTKVNGEDTMSGYTILGEYRGESVGEGGSWMDMLPGLFSAAGGAAGSLIEKKKTDDAAAKTAKDSEAALYAAITADQRAKDALAKALVSEELKSSSASADRMAADMALSTQDEAARGLSPENQKKRSEAAKKALEKATNEWQAASANNKPAVTKAKELWVKAAQTIYAKTQNALMVSAAQLPGGLAQQQWQMQQMQMQNQSWFTRPVLGPIPGYGVVGGLAAVAVAAAVVLKKGR